VWVRMPRRRHRHERLKDLIKESLRCDCEKCSACRHRLAEMLELVV
jgi:hypothetical protein